MNAIDAFDREITAALLDVAGRDGWGETTMAAIAAEAGVGLGPLRARFPSREAILLRFGTVVDTAVVAQGATGETAREKLFDVLMRRFDALQPHRAGVLAVARALPSDPCLLAVGAPAAVRSMAWMLEAAGIPAAGITGQLRAKALLALWLAAFRAWAKDENPDMGATMAALDRLLDRAEGLARSLEPLIPGARKPQETAGPAAEPAAEPAGEAAGEAAPAGA
ncbi:helix-turn-helix domain-containing protein [Elioraea sp.]|uniref:helix-turn-helix domain-containing protein n=1 Tax=Elioraea sp. TaxID=2185103 RepID=UPI0025C5955C|nr:helix-turn-helix domain-containing protein [Elioraea sp.]